MVNATVELTAAGMEDDAKRVVVGDAAQDTHGLLHTHIDGTLLRWSSESFPLYEFIIGDLESISLHMASSSNSFF